jgi:hypothetical protein
VSDGAQRSTPSHGGRRERRCSWWNSQALRVSRQPRTRADSVTGYFAQCQLVQSTEHAEDIDSCTRNHKTIANANAKSHACQFNYWYASFLSQTQILALANSIVCMPPFIANTKSRTCWLYCRYVPVAENTVGVCGDDKKTWSIGDGVHPNAPGHMRVGSVFALWMRNTLCPNHTPDRSC